MLYVKNKIDNDNFINKAPKNIVEHETKKFTDYQTNYKKLLKNLNNLTA